MGILKSYVFRLIAVTAILLFQFCTTTVAPSSILPKPEIETVRLNISPKFQESIHIHWSMPQQSHSEINSYTLLRMFDADTFFSVLSENIPADTFNFHDNLDPVLFPVSSAERNPVYYRIFAIDQSGRCGDTSEPCTLYLVQQPTFLSFDTLTGCLSWSSNVNFGGVLSYCKIWKDSMAQSITGLEIPRYPQTDKPAVFTTCFPAGTINGGRWFFALFIRSSEHYSLRIGYFDVP